jgi:hypothetical protein
VRIAITSLCHSQIFTLVGGRYARDPLYQAEGVMQENNPHSNFKGVFDVYVENEVITIKTFSSIRFY